MTLATKLLIGAGVLGLLIAMAATWKTILKTFLPPLEGFSAAPYWDYKQWSWGYGTKVPGSGTDPNVKPAGTVTRAQAWIYAMEHLQNDFNYLSKLITVPLSANRWAALLSFSYNLGPGNADNLISNINKQDNSALQSQWMSYVYAGGVVMPALIDRRAKEWSLWMKG